MDANIPGYAVINRMGEGGMASVYLAYQQNLERRVALKVLHPALAENPEYCSRFLREAKIGASLCHRNIVPVYEVGRFKNFHYLTMEYLPNGDLKQRLMRGCDTHSVLRIIYDVAAALGYAHSKSYIHRDIKPENIMFREDLTAVLTDFGVAVDVGATGGTAMRQQIAGSPQYMSPEHAKTGKLDFRSDIYSLGAVMFEALAGRPVVEPAATLADAVRRMDEPLPRLPPEVSWLQPVLDRMLAKNPNDRFDDMGEVMQALEPCIEASGALSGGPRRRQQVADELGARQRKSEDFSSQPTAEPVAKPPPVRDDVSVRPRIDRAADLRHREADEELIAHRRAVEDLIYRDRDREPVLTPSAPTLVVDASEDLAAALASCPPLVSPPSDHVSRAQKRSRVGMLLLVLAVVAVPLALFQWPSLRQDLASMLSPGNTDESDRFAQLSGSMEQPSEEPFTLPSEPPGAIPDSDDSGLPTIVDSAPATLSSAGADNSAADSAPARATTAPAQAAGAGSAAPGTSTTPSTDTAAIADTAPPEPEQAPEEDLLQQADNALQATPPTQENLDNAYAKFREVLALSPSNRDAREGLASVASRYLDLASAALNRDQLRIAQEYLDLASKISTRHSLGSHLRGKISDMQYVLNRLYQLQTQPTAEPYRDAQNWDQ